MRQAGVLAAAGLIALEEMPKRLCEDHANAKFLAEALAALPGVAIDPAKIATNIVIFDIAGSGIGVEQFTAQAKAAACFFRAWAERGFVWLRTWTYRGRIANGL